MGAGSIHCEAVFNKDGDLYCRSDVCDLAYTTDILTNPDHQCLADKCKKPFQQGKGVECCSTDFTSEELGLLCATSEMEKLTQALSVYQYLNFPSWKQHDKTIAKVCPRLLNHADFISLAVDNNVTMVSELLDRDYSAAGITSKEEAAREFIKEYQDMAIDASHVHPQSTSREHVETWLTETVYANAVIRFDESASDADIEKTVQDLASLSAPVKFVAVHWNKLVTVDGKYESTQMSLRFIEKEMNIFALGFNHRQFFQEMNKPTSFMKTEADALLLLNALEREVQVDGVFTDHVAIVAHYENCVLARTAEISMTVLNITTNATSGAIIMTTNTTQVSSAHPSFSMNTLERIITI